MVREMMFRRSFAAYAILLSLLGTNLPCRQIHGQERKKPGIPVVEQKLEWLTGSGKDLRIRLQGKVLDPNGDPATDFKVMAMMKSRFVQRSLEPQLDGNEFEVWVPVNDTNCHRVDIKAISADGEQLALKRLMLDEVREAAVKGLMLTMQPASRNVEVSVVYNGKPVADARVLVDPIQGITKSGRTDNLGVARFRLLPWQKLSSLHAWTDDFKIGGYSFNRTPARDTNANQHVIELISSRTQKLRFLDVDNSPVANIEFHIEVVTSPTNFSFLGTDPNSHISTDDRGEAFYQWFPDWKKYRCYINIKDKQWVLAEGAADNEMVNGTIVVKLKKSRLADRKQVVGRVSSPSGIAGGFWVLLSSFQGEEKHSGDWLHVFTDHTGMFSVRVLPDATYCAFVNDGRWVSETRDLIPYESAIEKTNSPTLTLAEGTKVEVILTAGPDKKPVANQWMNLTTPYEFSWREDGRTRHGTDGRRWRVTTDDQGRATTYAWPGKLKGLVYADGRISQKTIKVGKNGTTIFEFHQKFVGKRKVTGKLVLAAGVEASLEDAKIEMRSVDGETDDRKSLLSDKQGAFAFETKASQIGIFVYTQDAKAAGAAFIEKLDSPIKLKLLPTQDYHGWLLGKNDKPLAGHAVRANVRVSGNEDYSGSFVKSFEAQTIETSTDEEGNYTLKGVPTEIIVSIRADAIDGSKHGVSLGKIYLEPNDTRPRAVSRLDKSSGRSSAKTLAERFRTRLRDCSLSGFHLMAIISNASGDSFVDANFMDYEKTKEVSSFMQIRVATGEKASPPADVEFAKKKNWPSPGENEVFACAFDVNGNELGRIEIVVDNNRAPEIAAKFIREHAPKQVDAKKKWNDAFAEAKRSNRKVWVRVSQRYCGPCFALSRWMDGQKELLEKDYVMLKIDDVRDLNGFAVAKRLTRGRHVGVPFHAIHGQDEKMLVDSESPIGNIGHPSGYEGKKHLRKMISATRGHLTDDEVERIVESLKD